MIDPLTQIISLLRPRTVFSKVISGAGSWAVSYPAFNEPSFCTLLEGKCILAVDGQEPVTLADGDFVLMPATPGFTLSSMKPALPVSIDSKSMSAPQEGIHHGRRDGPPDMQMLGGYFVFDSPDAELLVSLLPTLLHLRGMERLSTLVKLVREESVEEMPGRELILSRLVEVMLIEAIRSTTNDEGSPGLLRGLADARLATAIREMHNAPAYPWSVKELATKAALSRSAFFDRFSRVVGLAPMEYLLAWRMALAKDLLRRKELVIAEIAERVGYSSASSFSVAFTRHVGQPPSYYVREI